MDITVTLPNAKAGNIVAALAASPHPGWTPPAQGATAQQVKDALAAYYGDKWKDEVRDLLRQARRQAAIQAAVAADQALPDPLA